MYNWYNIANLTAFLALDIVSQELTLELEGLGQKEILITKGNAVNVLYEGVFLTCQFNDSNPFVFDGMACFIDVDQNLWLGFAV